MSYDELKRYKGRSYTGVSVGSTHYWDYPDGVWYEVKVAPDDWKFRFTSTKQRRVSAPEESGAKPGSQFHWYILADQKATKKDANSYETFMEGMKFKVGHKRPNWKKWSYEHPEQQSHRQKVIQILRNMLERLEEEEREHQRKQTKLPLDTE